MCAIPTVTTACLRIELLDLSKAPPLVWAFQLFFLAFCIKEADLMSAKNNAAFVLLVLEGKVLFAAATRAQARQGFLVELQRHLVARIDASERASGGRRARSKHTGERRAQARRRCGGNAAGRRSRPTHQRAPFGKEPKDPTLPRRRWARTHAADARLEGDGMPKIAIWRSRERRTAANARRAAAEAFFFRRRTLPPSRLAFPGNFLLGPSFVSSRRRVGCHSPSARLPRCANVARSHRFGFRD